MPPQDESLTPPLQEGHELVLDRPPWDASWPWPLSAVEDFFKDLWNFLINLPWTIIDYIWGFIKNLWDFVSDSFNAVFNWIGNALDTLWNGVSTFFGQIWEGITSGFNTIVSWVSNAIGVFVDSISRTLQSIWDAISGAFQTFGEWIWSGIQAIWDSLGGFFSGLWEGISAAFTNFAEWIGDTFSGLWEAIGGWLANLGAAISEGLNAFGEWLNEGVVKPLAALPANLLGGVVDFVADLFEHISQWLVNLAEPIANFFVSDVLGGLIKVFQPFAELFESTMSTFFETLTGQVSQGGTMTPENAYNVVPSMISVLGITLLGFTGMTVAGELLHPLKEMGLGNVSAILYDVSNYKLISGAFVGALTYAMIRQPLGYYFNQWFHPTIPDERAIRELMSRKAFEHPETLRNPELTRSVDGFAGVDRVALAQMLLGYHGYHSGYYGLFKELANTPLRYFPLAGIARTGYYDFEWFDEALARSGYSQTAVEQLHRMYQAMVLEDARGRHSSTAVKRYKEGFIDEGGFRLEMGSLGYSDEQVDAELIHARLEYAYDYTADLLDAYRYAYRKGKIDEEAFRRGLGSLGISEERIEGWVSREGVRRKEEDRDQDLAAAKAAHASTVVKRFREGLIDEGAFERELAALGYNAQEIGENRVYASLEYETDFALDLLDGYRYAFRNAKIDEEEFRRGLGAIGFSDERIAGWVFREGVRRKAES